MGSPRHTPGGSASRRSRHWIATARSERAISGNTFGAIVEATEQRLSLGPAVRATGLVPNVFLIDVLPDETDPWSQMRDDRGTVVAFMVRYAEDVDDAIATIWRAIAEDFDVIRFSGGDGVIRFRT